MAENIAILGGGNIGMAVAEGLIQSGKYNGKQIIITRRKIQLLDCIKKKGVFVTNNNNDAVIKSKYIIIAVQPRQLKPLLKDINKSLNKSHVLISVVTGVGLNEMETVIGKNIPLFRAMPNTAISIKESMTCISTKNGTRTQTDKVKSIFDLLGLTIFVEEEQMASATVLAACGVAFCLRYIRAASQAGIEVGFDAETAQLIASQTVKGSASLLLSSGKHPEKEIDKVTTPMGCTIAGLNEMEHQGFSSALIKGITTSYNKIANIAAEISNKS